MQNDPKMNQQQQQQYQYQPPPQHNQNQYQPQSHSPGKSPLRASSFPPFPQAEPEMQHSTAILGSPSKTNWPSNSQSPYAQQQSHGALPFSLNNSNSNVGMDQHAFNSTTGAYNGGGGSPHKFLTSTAPTYSYSFSTAPSIFETLLRETEQNSMARTGSKFYEAVESLQRLNADVRRRQLFCQLTLVARRTLTLSVFYVHFAG